MGFRGGEFGLAGEEVEVQAFLAQGDAFRELAKSVLNRVLRLLEFAFVEELVGALGEATVGFRAGGEEKDDGKSEGNSKKSEAHGGRLG